MSLINRFSLTQAMLCCMALLISGCDQDNGDVSDTDGVQLYIEHPMGNNLFSSPQSRAFDPSAITPEVIINNQPAAVTHLGEGTYQVTGEYEGNLIVIEVEWSVDFEGVVIPLAETTKTVSTAGGTEAVSILATDYTINFDRDKDLDFNLDELKLDLNPRNSNWCTRCRTDVASHIKRISQLQRPVIDVRYDDIWGDSQFKDITGDLRLYANYDLNGDWVYKYASMHDDQNLYIYLIADSSAPADKGGSPPVLTLSVGNFDSPNDPYDNVFFPGLSLSSEQVFQIPLEGDNGGPYVQDNGTYVVATNASTVWEMSFDLASLGVGTEKFFLSLRVDDGSPEIWPWNGVVILNQ